MTKRIIKLEFVTQPGNETLVPRTDPRWEPFQNTYAVWTSNRSVVENITIRRKIELQQGYYYVTGTVDNSGSVTVNGTRINLRAFNQPISRTNLNVNTRVYHIGGLMDIVIDASNAGDVAGVAVTISKELSITTTAFFNYATPQGRSETVLSVGDLVWSTRTPGQAKIGRYLFTMPYAAAITAHVWGAGGSGAAGSDFGSNWLGGSSYYAPPGGRGSPGLYNTQTFTVAAGDQVEVMVGSAGVPGTVLRGAPVDGGNTPGGAGGASRTDVGGVAAQSYNGGQGGQGGRGWTGARYAILGGGTGGGGGGGASGVLVNNSPAIVAGGGGGGGGSGIAPDFAVNGSQGGGDSNAAITKNAIGDTPGDNRGENGRNVGSNDIGGGGGGGGGGYPGGQGGMSRASLDSLGFHYGFSPAGGTGFHGKCGGNYPAYPASTGAGTLYYDARYGQGGAGGIGSTLSYSPGRAIGMGAAGGTTSFSDPAPGQSGTDGRVVLIMEPIGLSSVKVGGEWRQITEAFYKVGGVWKDIDNSFIKINDQWKPIEGGGGAEPDVTKNPGDYGQNNRNWS